MFKSIKELFKNLFTKETQELTMRYSVKINNLSTTCSKFYIDHENQLGYISGLEVYAPLYEDITFDYRNGYYKGNGTIVNKFKNELDENVYEIEIEKYNNTKLYEDKNIMVNDNARCPKCETYMEKTVDIFEFELDREDKNTKNSYVIPDQACYKCPECGETTYTASQLIEIGKKLKKMRGENNGN